MNDKTYSNVQPCGHCQNISVMEILSEAKDSYEEVDVTGGLGWYDTTRYELCKCPSCKGVNLRSFCTSCETAWMEGPEVKLLYPQPLQLPVGLPERIKNAYLSAQRLKSIDANAFAVHLRRMLELICKDQQATGDSLAKMLKSLSQRDLIPEVLANIAGHLKDFGNVGAHAEDFDITEAEIPILDSLARAIAEYIYTAPALAKQAEERFRELKEGNDK